MSHFSRAVGRPAGVQKPCKSCGALSARWFCSAHDPDKVRRRELHDLRVEQYRSRIGRKAVDR